VKTAEAARALLSFVRSGNGVRISGEDDRGPETAGGEEALHFESGSFVLALSDFHARNGTRDRESETRHVRDQEGMVALLAAGRTLLIRFLLRARKEPEWTGERGQDWTQAPRAKADCIPASEQPARVQQVLSALERGPSWFALSRISGLREEALAFRPTLGWIEVELDGGREVGLEAFVRSLTPLEPKTQEDAHAAARGRAAAKVEHRLRWASDREATPEAWPEELTSPFAEIENALGTLGPDQRRDHALFGLRHRLWPEPAHRWIIVVEPAVSAHCPAAVIERAQGRLAAGEVLVDRREDRAGDAIIGIERRLRRRADGLLELKEDRWREDAVSRFADVCQSAFPATDLYGKVGDWWPWLVRARAC